jgi:chromosome segregation ATPase
MESRLTSRLEQHEGALAGVQQAVAELPQLESRLTSRLEQHEGALAGVQQAVAELPQLESRLTSRLEQHEGALSGVQQAVTELPQLESRLTSRLEQHEGALSGVQQAVAQIPQMESRLTARLEQHEGMLSGVRQAAAELPQVEPRLTARLDRQNALVEALQHVSTEQKSTLESVSRSVDTVQEQMLSLETRIAAAGERAEHAERAAQEVVEGAQHEAAELQTSLFGEIHALGLTVKSHAASIESIRASMARTDDFMERVVEALESLQTMVLEQARDRAVA